MQKKKLTSSRLGVQNSRFCVA